MTDSDPVYLWFGLITGSWVKPPSLTRQSAGELIEQWVRAKYLAVRGTNEEVNRSNELLDQSFIVQTKGHAMFAVPWRNVVAMHVAETTEKSTQERALEIMERQVKDREQGDEWKDDE